MKNVLDYLDTFLNFSPSWEGRGRGGGWLTMKMVGDQNDFIST